MEQEVVVQDERGRGGGAGDERGGDGA